MNQLSHPSTIIQTISSQQTDVGDFSVKRSLPTVGRKTVGPWIFFDHMGPVVFAPGDGINVRPHPHINLATVTYLFEGEILHRDSIGSYQTIVAGDINLMIAGTGIVHSERTPESALRLGQRMHGLQLRLALPNEYEETEPAFYHYPTVNKTFSKTLYLEVNIHKHQSLLLPQEEEELAIYIVKGSIEIEEQTIPELSMAILNIEKVDIIIKALQDSLIIIIGGTTIGHRYIDWNFASSSKERIEKAKLDWKNRRFENVVGDEKEFIPLPE